MHSQLPPRRNRPVPIWALFFSGDFRCFSGFSDVTAAGGKSYGHSRGWTCIMHREITATAVYHSFPVRHKLINWPQFRGENPTANVFGEALPLERWFHVAQTQKNSNKSRKPGKRRETEIRMKSRLCLWASHYPSESADYFSSDSANPIQSRTSGEAQRLFAN